jgi:hypothetical protein
LTRIEAGMSHPLPRRHVLGKRGELREDVKSAGLGNAPNRPKNLETASERAVLSDEGDGDLLQAPEAPVQLLQMLKDVLAHNLADLRAAVSHVQAVLFPGTGAQQSLDASRDTADLEDTQRRRAPGLEGHAPRKLEEDLGINGVCLGALQPGPGEVPDRSWVGDLKRDACTAVQRPGELETVDSCGFHADARRKFLGREPTDEPAVSGGRIGDLEHLRGSSRTLKGNGEGLGGHIDPNENGLHEQSLRVYDRFRLPDPEPSPTGLVMQAHRPQKLSGMGEEGGGPI